MNDILKNLDYFIFFNLFIFSIIRLENQILYRDNKEVI